MVKPRRWRGVSLSIVCDLWIANRTVGSVAWAGYAESATKKAPGDRNHPVTSVGSGSWLASFIHPQLCPHSQAGLELLPTYGSGPS